MTPRTAKTLKIAAAVVIVPAGLVFTAVFWAPLGLVVLAAIPIVVIGALVRAIVNELRGKRDSYTAGSFGIADLPEAPKDIRHFTTRFPDDRDQADE